MPKTQKDLMHALLAKLAGGGPQGALMKASFEQQVLPSLQKNPKWDEPISDEDFARQLTMMERELPAFLEYLLTTKFPAPPPDFGRKN